jgi:hypothetical protein
MRPPFYNLNHSPRIPFPAEPIQPIRPGEKDRERYRNDQDNDPIAMAKKKAEQVTSGRQYDGLLSSVSELLEQARRTSARVKYIILNRLNLATPLDEDLRVLFMSVRGQTYPAQSSQREG